MLMIPVLRRSTWTRYQHKMAAPSHKPQIDNIALSQTPNATPNATPVPSPIQELVERNIDRVANFMNIDSAWIMCRQFRQLRLGLLLNLQMELGEVTQEMLNDKKSREHVSKTLKDYGKSSNNVLLIYLKAIISSWPICQDTIISSIQRLSTFRRPDPIHITDFRKWASDHELQRTTYCAFLENKKKTEDDLIAPALALQEEPWVDKVMNRILWRALAKVSVNQILPKPSLWFTSFSGCL